ncbi:MAG: sortase [Bacilli bacterium]|nr:sortase [Bacilli bacterium]
MESKETKRIKKKHKRKSWLIVIGSLIILLGVFDVSLMFIKPAMQQEQEENALKDFYIKEEQKVDKVDKTTSEEVKEVSKSKVKYDYIAVLKIPKINLEKGLVAKDSKYNNINYGVEILKESDSPDVINGNVILAAHSGTANISYFRNLDKINVGDEAIIYYQGKTYNYKFVKIYDINKTGKAKIKRDNNTSTLTLVTCRHNTNKQIVLIAELQNLQ